MPLFGGGRRAAWAMVPARAGKPLSAAVPPGFHVPAEFFVSFGGWRRGASDSLDGLAAARLRERPLLLPQGCGRGACYVENRSPKRLAHPLRFLRSPSLFLNFSPPAFPACFPCLLLRLLPRLLFRLLFRLLSRLLSRPASPLAFPACFPRLLSPFASPAVSLCSLHSILFVCSVRLLPAGAGTESACGNNPFSRSRGGPFGAGVCRTHGYVLQISPLILTL